MNDLSKIDTTMHIGSISIHQPVTAYTGLIISMLCCYFYLQLTNLNAVNKTAYYWSLFFLNLLFATFTGACSHAFFAVHGGASYKACWFASQLFNGFSVYAAQQATLSSALQFSENKKRWQFSYTIQLLLMIPCVFIFQNFLVVVIDAAVGLIPIMVIHFKDAEKEKTSLWIAYGIFISFLTAFIHLFKISFHVYFNHLDIAHVLIMINLSVMFLGIKQKAISLV